MPEYTVAKQQYDKLKEQRVEEYNRQIVNTKDEHGRQQLQQQYSEWLVQVNVEIMTPIVNKTKQTINRIAAEKQLEHIYDSRSREAANAETDITTDVIASLAHDRAEHHVAGIAKKQPVRIQSQSTVAAETASSVTRRAQTVQKQPVKDVALQLESEKAVKAEKPEKLKKITQQVVVDKGTIVIQFGADTTPDEMRQRVTKAKKNGIASAYLDERINSKGRKWWMARATANNKTEADSICARLRSIGLDYYIVR